MWSELDKIGAGGHMALSKRERTRREIATQAFELFEKQGYDNVTVAQIVKAAGVSHMTFFRNFPTRVHVFTSTMNMPLTNRLIASAPFHLGPMECACWSLLIFFRVIAERSAPSSIRMLRIIGSSEALGSEIFGSNSAMMVRLATSLQGRGVDEWESRMVSSAILGAVSGAVYEWSRFDPTCDLTKLAETVVNALLPDQAARDRVFAAAEGHPDATVQ